MMKKIFLSMLIFLSAFTAAGALKVKLVDAAGGTFGYIWGGSTEVADGESYIDWMSTNSAIDLNASGGASYAINIPAIDGPVAGYAWSSNLHSYIDFAPHAGCPSAKYAGECDEYPRNGPTKSDVMRSNNKLIGFARIVNIAVAKAAGNAGVDDGFGGDDGWISMDPGVAGYGVTIGSDGKVSGLGWAGNTIGGLDFNSGIDFVQSPIHPIISLSFNNPAGGRLFLSQGEKLGDVKAALNWKTDQSIANCTASCTDSRGTSFLCPDWSDNVTFSGTNIAGNYIINIASISKTEINFKLQCKSNNNLDSNIVSAKLVVGCGVKICGSSGGTTNTCTFDSTKLFQVSQNDKTGVCADLCTSDSDCKPRQADTWREVAP